MVWVSSPPPGGPWGAGRPPCYATNFRRDFLASLRADIAPSTAILDIGAGRRPTLDPRERPKVRYVGLDRSAHALAAAPPGSYTETVLGAAPPTMSSSVNSTLS